jgi:hypothetical protein
MHNFALFWYSICLFKCQFNWNTLEDEKKREIIHVTQKNHS